MRFIAATISFLLAIAIAAQAEQAQPESKYGDRPESSIYDPSGILTVQEQEIISKPLHYVFKNDGVDVLIVILPEIGDAPPEHVAKGFAAIWAKHEVNSVVLHVPGQEGSPWIFPGEAFLRNINPDVMREAIVAAEKRSAAESSDFGKVRSATTEATDMLRYWKGGAVLWSEKVISHRMALQQAYEKRRRLMKLLAAIGAAALIPLAVGLSLLAVQIRNSRPRAFPEVKVIPRLGAPYAGGNSVFSKHGISQPTK